MAKYTAQDYLNEEIDYGGILTKRGEVIADLKRLGGTPAMIDRYLQGGELREQLTAQHKERNDGNK